MEQIHRLKYQRLKKNLMFMTNVKPNKLILQKFKDLIQKNHQKINFQEKGSKFKQMSLKNLRIKSSKEVEFQKE